MAMVAATSAMAANYVDVSVDHVTDRVSGAKSTVQYVRAGKEINGLQFGLQSRNARSNDGTGLYSSLEGYVGKNYSLSGLTVTPYVGVGRDLTRNGASDPFTYGLVGASVGKAIGPGYALAGVKTRVGSTEATNTHQTVTFVQYGLPVAKNVAVTAGVSRSAQDIKERAISVGLSVGF